MSTMINATQDPQAASPAVRTTHLVLVTDVPAHTDSPDETVVTVLMGLESGRVELTGSFRGCPVRGVFTPPEEGPWGSWPS
jgi:hypothetical protein